MYTFVIVSCGRVENPRECDYRKEKGGRLHSTSTYGTRGGCSTLERLLVSVSILNGGDMSGTGKSPGPLMRRYVRGIKYDY